MGVPTSEVGYTIATSRRETTKVRKNMWWHFFWGGGEKKKNFRYDPNAEGKIKIPLIVYVKIQSSLDSYNLCTGRWTVGLEAKYRR